MTKRYYTIRFEHTDGLNHAGKMLQNANNLLRIGQTESCDVRLENNSQYEDAVIAVIEKRPNDKGWKLIRTSPFREHEVRVNGTPINYVHFLNDGDRIAFEGQRQELVFNIHEDELYTSSGIVPIVKKSNRLMIAWVVLISTLVLCIGLQELYTRPMTDDMIESAKQSVYQIKVDSVQLIVTRGDSIVLLRSTPIESEVGTAFLTTDGQLVTARHCIEPWLDFPKGTSKYKIDANTPQYVMMALEAVTNNILYGDSVRWKMVSHCSLRKPENNDSICFHVTSEDFIFDDSRDHIVECGDYNHQYFWRSIKARPHRTDMMLGDIAFIPDTSSKLHHQKGNIRLATKEEVRNLCRKANRPLVIMGRMGNKAEDKQIQSPKASLKLQLADVHCTDGYPNTMIAHDGNIGHGFSGGPVLTQTGFSGWCAIATVSVIDNENDNWYYSVPVSEIERMKNKN